MRYLVSVIICVALCVSLSACRERGQIDSALQATQKSAVTADTAVKIDAPISSNELQGIEYTEIAQLFSEAGFTNVETEIVYDQDPNTLDGDYLNEVKIFDSVHFARGDEFDENSLVKVICHLPYAEHDVVIHIDFIPNLIFSTYDVDYAVNGEKMGTLTHGDDKDLSFRLKEGEHTVTFFEKGDSSNYTDLTLDVDDDIEAAYKLFCANDKITLDSTYVERKHAAGEGQAMVPASAVDFKRKNHKTVLEELGKAGFTNIETDILYDILPGWTGEGEVESVTIDTATNYARGDVFEADVPIVITYHMSKKDSPVDEMSSDTSDNEFDGIIFEMAYVRRITTKRDRLNTYYLFGEDEKIVYEVVYSKGPVPQKGTVEKTIYKIGTFEGELGGDIVLHLGDETFYYTTRTGSMIRTDEQGTLVNLNHDQWDQKYTQCEISDALVVLRKAEPTD